MEYVKVIEGRIFILCADGEYRVAVLEPTKHQLIKVVKEPMLLEEGEEV